MFHLIFFTFVVHLRAFVRHLVVVVVVVVHHLVVVENRYCFGQQLVGIQCGRIP